MPESYRPPLRKDEEKARTTSQSVQTNMAAGDATVKDIIDSKGGTVFTIRPQQTLHEAVELLRDHRIGALLVTDAEGTLKGILSERDIVRKLADTPGKTLPHRVEEVMTSKVVTCTPDERLTAVLRRMSEGRFRHVPVVSDDALIGMVTIGDVVNFRLNQLELEALRLKQLIVG